MGFTRRKFLEVGGLTVAAAALGGLAGCSTTTKPTPAGSAAPAAGTSGATAPAAAGPKPGGKLKVAFNSQMVGESLDAISTRGEPGTQAITAIYETLLLQDAKDELRPSLASEWQVTPNGLQYTFKLRRDVQFHDGTPWNAEAALYNFKRWMEPPKDATWAPSYANVKNFKDVKALDDYTIQLDFKEPYPSYLIRSGTRHYCGFVSPAAVKKYGDDFKYNPVGTGPFKFKEWTIRDHFTFVRNPDYKWASPIYRHQGQAFLDEIEHRFIPENGTRLAALESGDVNLIFYPPEAEVPRLKSDKKFSVIEELMNGTNTYLALNTEKFPTNELAVRQAMCWATDRDTICRVIFNGLNQAAYSILSARMYAADPKQGEQYKFDLNKAKQTLENAGWKAGSDGIRIKDGKRLDVLLITSGDAKIDTMVQAQWKAAGIDLKIQQLDPAGAEAAQRKGDHNVVGWGRGFVNEDPDVLRTGFHSANKNSTTVYHRFTDAALDKLLDEGYQTPRSEKRKQIYADVQKIIMDNALVVTVSNFHRLVATRAEVQDVWLDVRGVYAWFFDAWMKQG